MSHLTTFVRRAKKFTTFLGPGIMVSVAYFDPGNYSEAVSAGGNYQYKLLFAIFASNLFAVLLQCLCIKLGSVTGLDLAEMCRKHFPRRWNYALYAFAELAIIATDLAEVVGTAIALNILFHIPLLYGVLLTILDVLIILMAYKPESGLMKQVRGFEVFVSLLVLATCVCFVLELFKIDVPDKTAVWRGFLPSKELTEHKALYISLGLLGATVMPHSLYLGSALAQPRLKEYDIKHGRYTQEENHLAAMSQDLDRKYKPSVSALNYCLNYSYAELISSLFLIAMFINSAILIVSGATLYQKPGAEDADLLSIYEMLSTYISPAAGLIFALAMLCSGQSAGIVCTMAGQIVSEGFVQWRFSPWVRRLITRMLAIVPCIAVVLGTGRSGVAEILNGSQVVLSLILPLVSAPLIYFTSVPKYMMVELDESEEQSHEQTSLLGDASVVVVGGKKYKNYANGRLLTFAAVSTWCLITFLNLFFISSLLFRGEDVF
ncbi:hypothetical protein BABINDRAFT_159732 [Babjeviella inositovora NRRL Y-12698]|uniref:Uncharacterized protein n=1 Tax=Babjeviella inositovora NRRL Y-12698 TaxID=984486 RepID=A0A1E3QUU0_9ASCO|nr:uncharacterized protein BABINDRAFT_159732 [Babjeviella inositovora NRRL Y-12698]ODQ81439.1 hypothetical protein BABINDRAFT_159732 [Babjeviella inositovora NRRL Y-12698]